MAPVPVTVVAGGAEAFRLATQIADEPGGVLIGPANELRCRPSDARWIPVVADIGSRTPGCACCRLRVELTAAVERAVIRRDPPSRVVVLAAGDDDAVTVVYSILSDTDLQRLVRLDAVVATVDAVQLATRIHSDLPIATDSGLDCLAIADRVVVSRARDVTPHALGEVGHVLRSLNQVAPVIAPAIARCTVAELTSIDAWHGAPRFGPAPRTQSPLLGAHDPRTVVCITASPLDAARAEEWLDQLVERHAPRLLRVQGAVTVSGESAPSYFHGVRSFAATGTSPVGGDAQRAASRVVIIGRELPTAELLADFAAAQLSP